MEIQQIGITVSNVEASIDFYSLLGFDPIETHLPGQARLQGKPNTLLVLHAGTVQDAGAWVYIQVEDLQEMVRELQGKGVTFKSLPEKKAWIWEEAWLDDIDGNHIVLYRKPDKGVLPPWKIH